MPSPEFNSENLIRLVRAAVSHAVREATARPRVTTTLSGNVEDLDDDLDVVYIRMDQESMGTDPTQSDNYGSPGIIPASRLGETYIDEQVRVDFSGTSGATAMRTSTENRIVLPYGAEAGQHIVLDGNTGTIEFYDEANQLVGFLDSTQWFVGHEGGATARIDPFGGLRLRDENDELRALLSSSEGLSLRDATSGINGLIARAEGLTVLDPATGESVSITSGTTSSTPTPHWASEQSLNPGTTLETPAPSGFGTSDDLDLRWVCSSAPSELGAITHTPPGGLTELTDSSHSANGSTLATSLAVLDPVTTPVARTFTSSSGSLTRHNGHSVIVRGGGSTSPSVRSTQVTYFETSSRTITFDIDYPAGVVNGDLLVVFVSLAGPNVPVGWTVPNGWTGLGVQIAGLGTTHVLGSGVWFRRAGASEPSSETVSINMSATGLTKVEATAVAIQNPYSYPAGLDIRRNNRSMPRGFVGGGSRTSDTTAWAGNQLPQTVLSTSDMELLAGRRYSLRVYDFYEWGVTNASHYPRATMQVSTNGGSTWNSIQHVFVGRQTGGVFADIISTSSPYIPASNVTARFRVNVVAVNGTSFTFQALANTTDSKATLEVHDDGAEF